MPSSAHHCRIASIAFLVISMSDHQIGLPVLMKAPVMHHIMLTQRHFGPLSSLEPYENLRGVVSINSISVNVKTLDLPCSPF